MKPVEVIVIGAGDRGNTYAGYANAFPEKMTVTGVAEPDEVRRNLFKNKYRLSNDQVFHSWEEIADRQKFADAVIIATQDNMHLQPAIAFADLGYDILLEKPMASSAEECKKIVKAVKKNNVLLAVCHVLRYTNYTRRLKEILDSGTIGEIISIQHLEPVGYWHQAHSFVRGNWRNEQESNFMLLAKSCHDLDWINHIMNRKCKKVSSFGSLNHFVAENKPEGAADRCISCSKEIEQNCPYSAMKIYNGFLRKGVKGWPLSVLTPVPDEASILEALKTGPYGRCVYSCDNDVVDHQVVNMEFENNSTAAFTMTAFTKATDRKTRIFGSRGEIEGDGRFLNIHTFLTDSDEVIDTRLCNTILQGHGGGDFGLMESFVSAIQKNDPTLILSGPDESLRSHLLVFAAEEARKECRLVDMDRHF